MKKNTNQPEICLKLLPRTAENITQVLPEQQKMLPQTVYDATNQDKMLPKQQKMLPETA